MVKFDGQPVNIVRDNAKEGMRLTVSAEGKITVTLGVGMTYDENVVLDFVNKHKRFVHTRLMKINNNVVPEFNDGGKICLLGREYSVVRSVSVKRFFIKNECLYVPQNFVGRNAKRFFGELLLPYARALTEFYAKTYGLKYSTVGTYARKTAWGTHYSKDNSIKYNICLVFASKDVIEYIVVHELCHFLQANHSKKFWAEVARLYPTYKKAEKELKLKYNAKSILTALNLA